jgi:ribonuclease HII
MYLSKRIVTNIYTIFAKMSLLEPNSSCGKATLRVSNEEAESPLPNSSCGKATLRVSNEEAESLMPFYETDPNVKEIALDECGRGPMFGRVYAAAVILPRDSAMFDYSLMKDSKKIHSKKKMKTLAEYIKNHATAYSVQYAESDVIDRVNILQANMQCMHACIRDITERFPGSHSLLIDGNYFKPYGVYDEISEQLKYLPHTTIEKGDGKYAGIAAASILAKYERDTYIGKLCEEYPELVRRYGIDTNMGYGTKIHMEGIEKYGITQWHRTTFGACKTAPSAPVTEGKIQSDLSTENKKKTYYAVRKGRTPGVYYSWEECEAQVKGFSHAEYHKFTKLDEAETYLQSSVS